MPSYPSAIKSWTDLVDNVDTALAIQLNEARQEITAIQTELGTDPAGTYIDVKDRLAALFDVNSPQPLAADWDVGNKDITNINQLMVGSSTLRGTATFIDANTGQPNVQLGRLGEALDAKYWALQITAGGTLEVSAVNDANTDGKKAISITRSGYTPQLTRFDEGNVQMNKLGIAQAPGAEELEVTGTIRATSMAINQAPTGEALVVTGNSRLTGYLMLMGGEKLYLQNPNGNTPYMRGADAGGGQTIGIYDTAGETQASIDTLNQRVSLNKYETSQTPYYLDFNKSRGTEGVPAAVIANDTLGALRFFGYGLSDAAFSSGAIIDVVATGTFGTSNHPADLRILTAQDTATEHTRFTSDKLIGVNTPTPGAILDVITSQVGHNDKFVARFRSAGIVAQGTNPIVEINAVNATDTVTALKLVHSGSGSLFQAYDGATQAVQIDNTGQLISHLNFTAQKGIRLGAATQGTAPGIHGDGTNVYLEADTAGKIYHRPDGTGVNNALIAHSKSASGAMLQLYDETGIASVNIYHSSATELKTDNALYAVGNIKTDGTVDGLDIAAHAHSGGSDGANIASLDDITDVDLTTTPPALDDHLKWDGSKWVPAAAGGGGAHTMLGSAHTDASGAAYTKDIMGYDGTYWTNVGVQMFSTAADNFTLMTRTNTPNPNFRVGVGNGAGAHDTNNTYLEMTVGALSIRKGRIQIENCYIGTTQSGYNDGSAIYLGNDLQNPNNLSWNTLATYRFAVNRAAGMMALTNPSGNLLEGSDSLTSTTFRFSMGNDGKLSWGDGIAAPDCTFRRPSANLLRAVAGSNTTDISDTKVASNKMFQFTGADTGFQANGLGSSTNALMSSRLGSDSVDWRYVIKATGQHEWGDATGGRQAALTWVSSYILRMQSLLDSKKGQLQLGDASGLESNANKIDAGTWGNALAIVGWGTSGSYPDANRAIRLYDCVGIGTAADPAFPFRMSLTNHRAVSTATRGAIFVDVTDTQTESPASGDPDPSTNGVTSYMTTQGSGRNHAYVGWARGDMPHWASAGNANEVMAYNSYICNYMHPNFIETSGNNTGITSYANSTSGGNPMWGLHVNLDQRSPDAGNANYECIMKGIQLELKKQNSTMSQYQHGMAIVVTNQKITKGIEFYHSTAGEQWHSSIGIDFIGDPANSYFAKFSTAAIRMYKDQKIQWADGTGPTERGALYYDSGISGMRMTGNLLVIPTRGGDPATWPAQNAGIAMWTTNNRLYMYVPGAGWKLIDYVP